MSEESNRGPVIDAIGPAQLGPAAATFGRRAQALAGFALPIGVLAAGLLSGTAGDMPDPALLGTGWGPLSPL